MIRKTLLFVLILIALTALGLTATWVLGSFRARGDVLLKPREKAGFSWTVSETLTHGTGREATHWAGDYVDEVLEVRDGRPARVRRSWVSALNGHQGAPRPTPLVVAALVDDSGARDEKTGQPFLAAPVTWPDPWFDLLPSRPVHNYTRWTLTPGAAGAAAACLTRAAVTEAHGEAKLEPEETRDGKPVRRVRVALEATLEDGRSLRAWADIFVSSGGQVGDVEWVGKLDGKKGEVAIAYRRTRVRR